MKSTRRRLQPFGRKVRLQPISTGLSGKLDVINVDSAEQLQLKMILIL